jgi:hypothetical protein
MVAQNCTGFSPFDWTGPKERAAALLAADEMTDLEIAEEIGVARRTLSTWKDHPEFARRVRDLALAIGQELTRHAIALKLRRMRAYDERWRALQRIIAERAADPAMQSVPGGKTGLLVRRLKSIGAGENAREVSEYEVDTALLKELRELEKQAAQEAGQWSTKHEVRGAVASVSVIPEIGELLKMPAEDLLRLHRETLGLPGPGDSG